MKFVTPKVHLVARPYLDVLEMMTYLHSVEGTSWLRDLRYQDHPGGEAEDIVEAAGRLCYRSWKEGLNPNVSRVRKDHTAYLQNILKQQHGSVLEHANYTFIFRHVSRVFTHELVRHRAGVAISQESMRYVRLDELPFWMPKWAESDQELSDATGNLLAHMQEYQQWCAKHFGLDEPDTPFAVKKRLTSFMRRLAPEGVATDIMWTANIRTLRHVIEVRTSEGAEEEIRLVFGKVAKILKEEAPALFGDFEENATGGWTPSWSKV